MAHEFHFYLQLPWDFLVWGNSSAPKPLEFIRQALPSWN